MGRRRQRASITTGAFAPQFFGYGHPRVVEAVNARSTRARPVRFREQEEGRLAELILEHLGLGR
ncbi:MAG: hypothetical protein R2724_13505 [Bryobacterales bacterium]